MPTLYPDAVQIITPPHKVYRKASLSTDLSMT